MVAEKVFVNCKKSKKVIFIVTYKIIRSRGRNLDLAAPWSRSRKKYFGSTILVEKADVEWGETEMRCEMGIRRRKGQ
jgi:hypothetical protein